jgi:hypothetical protein
MTLRLVDVSRYQVERVDPIDLARAQGAGYDIVNIALTGGRAYTSGPWVEVYVDQAHRLGMGVSTYHWLDGRTSGASQAAVTIARLRRMFGTTLTGFAHWVDVEESGAAGITPPTWRHVYDYVNAIQAYLGRPMGVYGADYYWRPRGWNGASLTDYLMGPPNDPVKAEPGDDDASWVAGWGGWPDRSVMQWAVRPLPGTGDCSLSVIRDHAAWAALTGGDVLAPPMSAASWVLVPCLVTLRAEFNTLAPARDRGADGSIGDAAHAQESSDHNPDETGKTPYSDADNINEVHAVDIDSTGPWPTGRDLDSRVEVIRLRHQSGTDDRLQNIIYRARIASRSWGWTWRAYTGASQHFDHAHFSARYTTAQESDTRPWGVLDGADMDLTPKNLADIAQAVVTAMADEPGQQATARGIHQALGEAAAAATSSTNTQLGRQVRDYLRTLVGGPIADPSPALSALLAYAASEAGEVPPSAQQIADTFIAELRATSVDETASALYAVLGRDKAAAVAAKWATLSGA